MLYRSICHQVSNQADKLTHLAIILLLANVSPTYSRGLPQGKIFSTYNMLVFIRHTAHCFLLLTS